MQKHSGLVTLTLFSAFILAACGGDSSDSAVVVVPPPPPPGGPTDAERASAASTTAATNVMCSTTKLGTYYWEIGDASGAKVSATQGSGGPTATTVMKIFSSSKWLYAANVVQKRGVQTADVPFLNFTSGYSKYGNAPICNILRPDSDTVQGCVPLGGEDAQDPTTIGRFDYDSGHMQHHAAQVMGLGAANNAALASDLNATVGAFGFGYHVPQLAAGVTASPQGYAMFLRKVLSGGLTLKGALGSNQVCANTSTSGCNAAFSPDDLPPAEAWRYSLGHWVESDPTLGDGAFSSAGGGGFYPWIDSSKTYYGIVARERETEAGAGINSEQCGRLIRQAWRTGIAVPPGTTQPNPAL